MRRLLGLVTAFPARVAGRVLRSRRRLPRWVNRAIDHVADNPGGILGRIAVLSLGGYDSAHVPPATSVPVAPVRVYIGPTNYAEQGFAWARALDASPVAVASRNMAVAVPGGFAFRADTEVPIAVQQTSRAWQEAELEAVRGFSHVLVEAERVLFGRLFGRDLVRETAALTEAGLSVAFMAHGTDVRLPSRHLRATPWSPFADPALYVDRLEAEAARNGAFLRDCGRPVFVSTPDLLADVPGAVWCPVVVEPARWEGPRPSSTGLPVVCHVPSNGTIKGTELVRPSMEVLAASGVVRYREVRGVPSAQMPAMWARADIVLDQFRLGSYGVAACEAMAAGCVVVGHVTAEVRAIVRESTGLELPVVEATPDDVGDVVERLARDPEERAARAAAGRAFVRDVHDGRRSADLLLSRWINPGAATNEETPR